MKAARAIPGVFVAVLAAAGCGVDYGILDGKQCDPAGTCASGYRCDLTNGRCVPEGTGGAQGNDAGRSDGGRTDSGGLHEDAGRDTGHPADGGRDAGGDTGVAPDGAHDGGVDAGPHDGGHDAGADAGQPPADGGPDAGLDAGLDASVDAESDTGYDGGHDAGHDAGFDAGQDAGFDTGTDAGQDAGYPQGDGGRDAGCTPACPQKDAVECRGEASFATCIDPDNDGCLVWSAYTSCGANEKCVGNACVCQPSCAGKCGIDGDGCGGSCSDPCNTHGTCAGGACSCFPGFDGGACDRCTQWYTGYPACVPCGVFGIGCCAGGACQQGLDCVGGACHNACPGETARVGDTLVCIDKFEASKDGSKARSAAGYAPWVNIKKSDAAGACGNAGKRLCTISEWRAACTGPSGNAYPYGANYVDNACVDDNGGKCDKGGGGVQNCGSRATCEGGTPGVFDMSGNVWEWVSDVSGGQCGLRGGSVDACGGGSDNALLSCTNDHWTNDCGLTWKALGFRCCKDVP